jgi:hypothetical protein
MRKIGARLNSAEEKKFDRLIQLNPGISESELIRNALFKRRDKRSVSPPPLVDQFFLGELSNILNGMIEANRNKEDLTLDLQDLYTRVNSKLAS